MGKRIGRREKVSGEKDDEADDLAQLPLHLKQLSSCYKRKLDERIFEFSRFLFYYFPTNNTFTVETIEYHVLLVYLLLTKGKKLNK